MEGKKKKAGRGAIKTDAMHQKWGNYEKIDVARTTDSWRVKNKQNMTE